MKTIQEVVESSASVIVDPDRVKIVLPEDFAMPPGGLHIRWPDAAAGAGSAADGLQVVRRAGLRARQQAEPQRRSRARTTASASSPAARPTTTRARRSPTWAWTTTPAARIGIRLHKVNVVWPLEATITRDFAQGLQEILVVEEKRQVIEYQLKEELYNWRADVRPNVLGKFDEPEGDISRRRMEHAQPERELAAARQGRPDAGDHRQGDRQAAEEAGRARRQRHRRAHGRSAWP